jgi:hypothetical protein
MSLFDTIKQTIRIFTHKDFTKNPNAPQITELQKKALWVGLINSEQLTAYTDSLTTGLPQGRVIQGLTEAWGIYSQADAYETVEWIQKGGHRVAFNAVLPYINITDREERNRQIENMLKSEPEKIIFSAKTQEELEEKYESELERLIEFADHIIECIAERGNDPFAPFDETNINNGILAWDLGRLVTIARMCYDLSEESMIAGEATVRCMDENTAWEIITIVYETAVKEFKDWREMAVSYLIGRGAWGGDTMMLDGLYSIAQKAFEDDNSPWKNVPLK